MSEAQEYPQSQEQVPDQILALPTEDPNVHNLKEISETLDSQSYFLGEVPQQYLVDPHAYLPLNSDRLIGSSNVAEKLIAEVGGLVQEEIQQIQKLQKKITFWEDRIEKNKTTVQANLTLIKQNNSDIIYDK